MKIAVTKSKWTALGFIVALLCGVPVLADDTELLLITPDTDDIPFEANILMIIDSSGSMATLEETNRPYNSATPYDGACNSDRIYWTRTGLLPSCSEENTQYVEDSAFVCEQAEHRLGIVGFYQDIMAQYRDDTTGATSWRTLGAGYATNLVECQADSEIDGGDTAEFPQAGVDLDPYTSIEADRLAWGSSPATETYTVYDGNYLNWRAAPPETVELTRLEIVKSAAKTAMNSIDDVNVGIMRFNSADGGPVIKAMTDLDTNRAELDAVIDGIEPNQLTPLSETMYEAALYWLGQPAYYGERFDEFETDPDALFLASPERYLAPDSPVCTRNFNVLLTDGEPVDDLETPTLAPTLPGFSDKLDGRTACTGDAEGDCLDDITEYLSIPDLSSVQEGDQFVTTHTIGFTIDLPILKQAAEVSGGEYYLADNAEDLSRALLEIFQEVTDQDLAFTAPAVAVNAFNRTQNLNDLYLSVFRSDTRYRWPGNLKKYRLSGGIITDASGNPAINESTGFFSDSARSFWTAGDPDGPAVENGGAANQLPDPSSRKLYTNNGDADLTLGTNAISAANVAAFDLADFGLTGSDGEPSVEEMIDWLRGADVFDEDNLAETTQRNAMGDPLHSQPATLFYGGEPGDEDIVVYMATNDGYLHAIDAETGVELWSFMPKELLPRSAALLFNPSAQYKSYGIDGDVVPVFLDRDDNGVIDGDDFAYIVFGMRRGGSSYYALDVTDKNSPQLLWNVSHPGVGQSWSRPTITRVNIGDDALNDDKAVVIIGAGYDPVHDTPSYTEASDNSGAGVLMLDLKTGVELWRAGRDDSNDVDLAVADMTRAIASQIRVIDLDGDRFADRMYATDVGGQLWRFDIFGGQPPASLVTGGVIARLGAEGIDSPSPADTRRVYNSPDVALFLDTAQNRRFLSINVGTGYRAHPLDTSPMDVFYSYRDPAVFNRLPQSFYTDNDIATNEDFVEVSGATQAVVTASDRGWKFTLPDNEMVLSNSSIFDGQVFFVAFSPDTVAASNCSVTVGKNVLYRMSILNGDPIVENIFEVSDEQADSERVTELRQGGIAPAPQFLFPSPEEDCEGAACSPPPVGCVGVECFDPGFRPRPVRTLWTQDGIE